MAKHYSVGTPKKKDGEWRVAWLVDGKDHEPGAYYTDDQADAESTASAMRARAAQLNAKQQENSDRSLNALVASLLEDAPDPNPAGFPTSYPPTKDRLKRGMSGVCRACNGHGLVPGNRPTDLSVTCRKCRGTGRATPANEASGDDAAARQRTYELKWKEAQQSARQHARWAEIRQAVAKMLVDRGAAEVGSSDIGHGVMSAYRDYQGNWDEFLKDHPEPGEEATCDNCGASSHHTDECPYSLGANLQ